MNGYKDPATQSNMGQAVHYDPNTGRMKTVSEFLTSPQPLVPIHETYEPYPVHMVAGSPYPATPQSTVDTYSRLNAPGTMTLGTLWRRPYGSTAR